MAIVRAKAREKIITAAFYSGITDAITPASHTTTH